MARLAFAVLAAALAWSAHADPVKCVDADGKVHYMDSSMPGTEKCAPVSSGMQIVPSQTYSRPPSSQGGADPQQREARITAAQNELERAKKALAEQEAIRNGDERNYQRVLDRLKPYQDAVESAQKNLENLQRQ